MISKIIIFFIIGISILVCINNTMQNESFKNSNTNEYTYNYTNLHDTTINDNVHSIIKKIKKNDKESHKLLDNINNVIMKIYLDSKNNLELKNYLKFMNFMNDDNTIFFYDMNPDVYLFHKIKIILVLFPQFFTNN